MQPAVAFDAPGKVQDLHDHHRRHSIHCRQCPTLFARAEYFRKQRAYTAWAPDGSKCAVVYCHVDSDEYPGVGYVSVHDSRIGAVSSAFEVALSPASRFYSFRVPEGQVCWSSCSSFLAINVGGGVVEIWNVKKGARVASTSDWIPDYHHVQASRFSPDGTRLLCECRRESMLWEFDFAVEDTTSS